MAKVTVIPPNETQEETLRVAAYCRVSSDSADQKHSYAAQIRAYTDLIGSHPGWELVDIYADEARTGIRADIREDFQHPGGLSAAALRLPEGEDRQGPGQIHLPLCPEHPGLPDCPPGAVRPGGERRI